ncbi:MAG: hypothetical protein Q7S15_01815 [bacterium]|nr:hypothetical protein [bacterium]
MARGENEWKGYPIDTGKLETGRYYDVLAVVPALVEGEHVALIRGWDAGPILSYQVPGAIAVGSYVIGRDEEIVKFWPCGAIRPAAEPT